jgi:hypothetical protein
MKPSASIYKTLLDLDRSGELIQVTDDQMRVVAGPDADNQWVCSVYGEIAIRAEQGGTRADRPEAVVIRIED